MATSQCNHCGAPRQPGLAVCRYCQTPLVEDLQRDAVPCPSCGLYHELGAQKCVACSAWLVVKCVFCSALSAHHLTSCASCGEAFAGALERFQARQQEQDMQKGMQMVSSVGGVAASLLGAVASSGIIEQVASSSSPREQRRVARKAFRRDEREPKPDGGGGGFFDELFSDTDPSDDGG